MQTQFQMSSYIHVCTAETQSLANLQDLICINYRQHKVAKVEIKSCRFARECIKFLHTWMQLPS